jgi:hypothetical protein
MSDDTVRKIIAQATENARPRVSWECAGCGADYEGECPPYCYNCVDGYAAIGIRKGQRDIGTAVLGVIIDMEFYAKIYSAFKQSDGAAMGMISSHIDSFEFVKEIFLGVSSRLENSEASIQRTT